MKNIALFWSIMVVAVVMMIAPSHQDVGNEHCADPTQPCKTWCSPAGQRGGGQVNIEHVECPGAATCAKGEDCENPHRPGCALSCCKRCCGCQGCL